jgi:hypothetical protein
MQERVEAGLDARRPGGDVAELGCTERTGRVAGGALRAEHLLAGLHRCEIGSVLDLDDADRADPLGDRFGGHRAAARRGPLVRSHEHDEQHDAEDRHQEGEENGEDQLLGGLDRAFVRAVQFFGFVHCAHPVLEGSRRRDETACV